MKKLIFATTNQGKLKEVRSALPNYEILSLNDFPGATDVDETEDTFLGNALLKARSLYKELGIPVIAEDSGIIIDKISEIHGGKLTADGIAYPSQLPGIYSARYASLVLNDISLDHNFDANNDLVLDELNGTSPAERSAHYLSTFVLMNDLNDYHVFEGKLHGFIADKPSGTNGFAYDTIFKLNSDTTETYADMTTDDKNKVSFRVKALSKLINHLNK